MTQVRQPPADPPGHTISQRDEAGLYRLQLVAMVTLVTLLVVTLGAYFIQQHIHDFEAESQRMESRNLARHEDQLRLEVGALRAYLDLVRTHAEDDVTRDLRHEVKEAHDLAAALYARHKDQWPAAAIHAEIREALKSLASHHGHSDIFVRELGAGAPPGPGDEELLRAAGRPDDELTVIRFTGPRPDGSGEPKERMAAGRSIPELNWMVAASADLEAAYDTARQDTLKRLTTLRTPESGMFAVLRTDGRVLLEMPGGPSTPDPGPALADQTDVVIRLVETARLGGGTVHGRWPEPGSGSESGSRWTSQTFAVSAPDRWNWVLVAGMRTDDLTAGVNAAHEEIGRQVEQRIWTSLTFLVVALMAAVALSVFMTRWLRRVVNGYESARNRSDTMLREHSRQLYLANFFLDHVSDIVVLADARRVITYVNPYGCKVLGAAQGDLVGRHAAILDTAGTGTGASRVSAATGGERFETVYRTADGRVLYLEVTSSTLRYDNETYTCAIARDVSPRKRAEWDMQLAAKVFDHAAEGMTITDERNHIVAVNDAFCRITGYARDEVLGQNPRLLASGRQGPDFYAGMWGALQQDGRWCGEIWNRRKTGEVYPEWLNIQAVRNTAGEVVNYIAAFSDVSETREQEERIRHLAQHDFLTDLPNRFLLRDRLQRAILAAARNSRAVALLYIDLDRFKTINDTLGHAVGDKLLRQVARRLVAGVRASDSVSRLGGDEFVVMLADIDRPPQSAGVVARKLLDLLSTSLEVDGHDLMVTPSIGIAVFPQDGDTLDTLLKNADMAMYAAKDAGRNTFRFFTHDMNRQASERLWVESNLRRAISQGELELHFQPQFSIQGRALVGCEALVRWRQPDGRLIPPAQFIPIAEDTGLILPLGDWVIEEACRRVVMFNRVRPVQVAVNLSAAQLRRPGLPDHLARVLARHGLNAGCLELEVTESVLMDDCEAAARTFAELREIGIKLSIDDFGTGYSSLSYLRRFRVDKLKIDRSFVQGLNGDSESAVIVEAIVGLAHALGIQTLAEGVETEEQMAHLASLGCGQIQGFLLGRPMPPEAFASFLSGLDGDGNPGDGNPLGGGHPGGPGRIAELSMAGREVLMG
jgi:diguanylate cyclase (GGDEF)-like protein/PAS domain S-box-containing protein